MNYEIAILAKTNRSVGIMNLLYPLFKWEKLLKRDRQVTFDIFTSHKEKKIFNYKTVLIVHRYFQALLRAGFIQRAEVLQYVSSLKDKGIKVIWWDAGDGSGSEDFDLIGMVDLFLKNQLLKDQQRYTENNGDTSVRVWINKSDLKSHEIYTPCPPQELKKLGLAWNIGLCDYRKLHGKLGHFTNRVHYTPGFYAPDRAKKFDTVFRGSLSSDETYSFQRNQIIRFLKSVTDLKVRTGGKVRPSRYMQELRDSKLILSPFGWGEICYRDFETFFSGSVLVKPSVEHLHTYPDVLKANVTYVPLKWDVSDVDNVIHEAVSNFNQYREIAANGQRLFKGAYFDGENFTNHFMNILNRVDNA